MNTANKTIITVEIAVKAPIEKVWKYWNEPKHITKWCSGHEDWHTPTAENDLRVNGKLKSRMEAKDGSMGFDFEGVYTKVLENKAIDYTIADGRNVSITFSSNGNETKIVESFEAESTNPVEMQQAGWQTILNNFKKYTEAN